MVVMIGVVDGSEEKNRFDDLSAESLVYGDVWSLGLAPLALRLLLAVAHIYVLV